jgi:hypothetical protein
VAFLDALSEAGACHETGDAQLIAAGKEDSGSVLEHVAEVIPVRLFPAVQLGAEYLPHADFLEDFAERLERGPGVGRGGSADQNPCVVAARVTDEHR